MSNYGEKREERFCQKTGCKAVKKDWRKRKKTAGYGVKARNMEGGRK